MAKKTSIKKEGQLPDPLELIQSIDSEAEVLDESKSANITGYISTGNYLLDACICGHMTSKEKNEDGEDMGAGFPANRVVVLAGESGTAKSVLACSVARGAQEKGYTVLYYDSESAIDKNFCKRLGVDTSRLIIRPVNTVQELSHNIAVLCNTLGEQMEKYGKCNKYYIVCDSLTNLSSVKEKDDIAEGANKADFSRQKAAKALFRIASPLANYGCGMCVVTHVYQSMDMFKPGTTVSGGSGVIYNASVILELSAAKLVDKENDARAAKASNAGDVVKTGVLITAKPRKSRYSIPHKVRFQIPFYKAPNPYVGLENYCSWEKCGICRGSFITEKEYNKLPDSEKVKIHVFDYNGETKYVQEKDTARGIVVRHLGEAVPVTEFFTSKVFTPEFLKEMDEKVIRPEFELPDRSSFDDIKEIEDLIDVNSGDAEE